MRRTTGRVIIEAPLAADHHCVNSATESERSMYDGLSPDDAFIVATIDERFHALTDAGCDPAHALMLAVQVDMPLVLRSASRRPAA